jgi:ABC-type sulfate transport system permease component
MSEKNRFQSIIDFSKVVDSWRVFPRIFIGVYLYLLYQSAMWFMSLEAPTTDQFGLVSVIVGAGAAWFGLYVRSKGDGNKEG